MAQSIKPIDEKIKVHKMFIYLASRRPATSTGWECDVSAQSRSLSLPHSELEQFGKWELNAVFIFHIPLMFHF